MHGSRELKSKIHSSRELKLTFHESRTIQRLLKIFCPYSTTEQTCRPFWIIACILNKCFSRSKILNFTVTHKFLVYWTWIFLHPTAPGYLLHRLCYHLVLFLSGIVLYRFWTRGFVFELPPWGLLVLLCALQTPARSSAFPIKAHALSLRKQPSFFALCYQQTHSLHLKMLLEPHNRQHLPKLEKRFPHCLHLYFRSPYLAIKSLQVTEELSMRVMWRPDMLRIGSLGIVRDERGILFTCLTWPWRICQVLNEFEFWNVWLLCTFGKFHVKWASYRPCSRISRNKLVISRITGLLSFTDHGK